MISKRIELLSVVLAVVVLVLVCVLVFKMSNKEPFQGNESEPGVDPEAEVAANGLPLSANNAAQATPEEIAAASLNQPTITASGNNNIPLPNGEIPLSSPESILQAQSSIELSRNIAQAQSSIEALHVDVNDLKSMLTILMEEMSMRAQMSEADNGANGQNGMNGMNGMNGEGPSLSVTVPSGPTTSPNGFTTSSLATTASLLTPE